MFVRTPRGRLVHFAHPDIESGWEDTPLREVGQFGGWSEFSMCGYVWNVGAETVSGPATCSKCIKQMGELVLELQTVQANIVSTMSVLIVL